MAGWTQETDSVKICLGKKVKNENKLQLKKLDSKDSYPSICNAVDQVSSKRETKRKKLTLANATMPLMEYDEPQVDYQ